MQIQLPKAEEWNDTENCAMNLRTVHSAGTKMCQPVGLPEVILADAGPATFALDGGDVLSVSDDRHDLFLNGTACGSLPAALVNVLPLGRPGHAVLFTSAGPQWLADGELQAPPPPAASVTLAAQPQADISADVLFAPLKAGDYSRMSGPLAKADARIVEQGISDALKVVEAEAAWRGHMLHQVMMGWRMVDAQGEVVLCGAPAPVGSLPEADTLRFKVQKTDHGLELLAADALTLTPWSIKLAVSPYASAYWRRRVARLEVVAWPASFKVTDTTGVLASPASDSATLSVSFNWQSAAAADAAPCVVASVDNPLAGVNMALGATPLPDSAPWTEPQEALLPSVVYRGGTLTAYAQAAHPGMLFLATAQSPLHAVSGHRVCGGNIRHICAPVGGGGGWNYGRLHLLVFATDGIYSVSVDSRLASATSTCLSGLGVMRSDAVVQTPEAVYAATSAGSLLRIVGSRCRLVPFPSTVSHLAWCDVNSELWAINECGVPFVMDSYGGVALRSNVTVTRVVGQHLVADSFGALRNLRNEIPAEVEVTWAARREIRFRHGVRTAMWKIDAAMAANLRLQLWADGGGTPQRLLELTVNGAINAPVCATVIAPARAYFTARIHGRLTPPARLNSVNL